LVPDPVVNYVDPETAGILTFTPVSGMSGQAVVTVTVDNGAVVDHAISQTFLVTVLPNGGNQAPTLDPINAAFLNEDMAKQTVLLSGISTGSENEAQLVSISATTNNSTLLSNPVVSYAIGAST